MGVRKKGIVLSALMFLAISPFVAEDAFAIDYKKHVIAEDLGVLQLAAHDLFNVDRCHGNATCSIEHEDGLLNLSTLFEDTTTEPDNPFDIDTIAIGGEHRNRENIMLFTVASYFGEKYKKLVLEGMDEDEAQDLIIEEYHQKLAKSYEHAFGEKFPSLETFNSTPDELFQQNLALRTIHDFLPGKIKIGNGQVSTLDPSLFGEKLNEKELKQKSSKLDGKFDGAFLDINVCLDPPMCNIVIMVNLLDADRTFGDQFKTGESFDNFLEQLEDGTYDPEDSVLDHIRILMAKGQDF